MTEMDNASKILNVHLSMEDVTLLVREAESAMKQLLPALEKACSRGHDRSPKRAQLIASMLDHKRRVRAAANRALKNA